MLSFVFASRCCNQGSKGPKGDTGPKGDKDDAGLSGLGGLSDTGFTMQRNINMARNKIIKLPDPTRPTEPKTRRYVEINFNRGLTADGFTMRDQISMGGHEIVDLASSPSTGTAAVSKNYADTRYVLQNTTLT